METFFDPPERTPADAVLAAVEHLAHLPLVVEMLEAFPTPAVLLEENRQIVACNGRALAAFEVLSPFDVHGLRLGEALDCTCAHKMEGGCGTSPTCAECGAAHAIRGARAGAPMVRECRITVNSGGVERSFDFRAFSTPIRIAEHSLVLLALEDVGDEKRRETLERIFFHDVLGAANAVHGLARLVAADDGERSKEAARSLLRATGQLLEEIQAQRDLMLAERGQLNPRVEQVTANGVVEAVCEQYRGSPLAEGRELVAVTCTVDHVFSVDQTQLIMCLGNLVRNALEAVGEGQRVTVSAQITSEGVIFQVANPGVIQAPLQLQVFQRSFSTKAARGRGIGTYSVKLIVEQYLMGRVSFISGPATGTIFSIWVPNRGVEPADAAR